METLSQTSYEAITVLIVLVIIGYYVDLIGRAQAPPPSKKPSKKQFLIGILPFAMWMIVLIETYSELD